MRIVHSYFIGCWAGQYIHLTFSFKLLLSSCSIGQGLGRTVVTSVAKVATFMEITVWKREKRLSNCRGVRSVGRPDPPSCQGALFPGCAPPFKLRPEPSLDDERSKHLWRCHINSNYGVECLGNGKNLSLLECKVQEGECETRGERGDGVAGGFASCPAPGGIQGRPCLG